MDTTTRYILIISGGLAGPCLALSLARHALSMASSLRRPPSLHPPTSLFLVYVHSPSGVFMTIPIDPEGKTLAWIINQPVNEQSREEWRELEGQERQRVSPMRMTTIFKLSRIPDLPKWHTPRVCLIGDAAHGLPPHGGLGSAMAFEDAAILTRLLT
ncbi:hypothetical protein B0H19DRAFT_1265441 [Mycena capillaripes]|nr:hypothetical protein B0H19DRAFT_1265441 [Mycena capillaripes]